MTESHSPLAVTRLRVLIDNRHVGTLAATPDGRTAFQYADEWFQGGWSISPLSLPLENHVFIPKRDPFNGLFGVFHDSLPDGWGALLLDRMLRAHDYNPAEVTPLTRLAIVGSNGRGALRYEPEIMPEQSGAPDDNLDNLATTFAEILADKPVDNLDEAYALGGSSAGARPKAYVTRNGVQWLVKFPARTDPASIGKMEYEYSLAARDCGIDMPRTRLFPSSLCPGYFGAERFDRDTNGNGIHMVTASGMLEVSHRLPLLDYRHLFQVTAMVTGDIGQAWNLFRLMCFNVFAHNQDDHSNNFAWLCENGAWHLSPAYDLTCSTVYGNEHSTTVNGKGNPTLDDILALAAAVGLPARQACQTAAAIKDRCNELLKTLDLP